MRFLITPLVDNLQLPNYAHPGDAGMDVFSRQTTILDPGQRAGFPLGFAGQPPIGHVVFVKPKSGLAAKHGLHTLAGVIDEGFRGEYTIWVINLGQESLTVTTGKKLAQLVVLPVATPQIIIAKELTTTNRNTGGFGSTGIS